MDLTSKYSDEIKKIATSPSYKKNIALKHFILLKDFQDNFLPHRFPKCSKTNRLKEYAVLRGVSYRSLLRWSILYRDYGIGGLLPKYRARDFGRLRVTRKHNRLKAIISIDIDHPLNCLNTIHKIIERCKAMAPDVKNQSLSLLDRYFNSATYQYGLHLQTPLSQIEIFALEKYKKSFHKRYSHKSTAILMANEGRSLLDVMEATHVAKGSIYRWLRNFNKDRLDSIQVRIHDPKREKVRTERRTRVIDIIHKMPSIYGINRTTWTYATIAQAYLQEYGSPISVDMIKGVIKETGCSWHHIQRMQTSNDPGYREKVERLIDTLSALKEGERFFFIDEVGPYQVKKYGGRLLLPADLVVTIPEHQKSRGRIQFVAALEAITNQMTWLFTQDKGSVSITKLFERIVQDHADCPAIYVTWDAITVHSSKIVTNWIAAHNEAAIGPRIEIVPLPSKAQFLNVIESVFCGMKKAVICNSDYATPKDMQEAIARHFEERNQYYLDNPKRAGNKIWDKQSFDFDKLIGGLFKK
jgi:transposase